MKKRVRKERHINWEIEPWSSFAFHRNLGGVDFRLMRRRLNLTQTQCAEVLDVHRKTVGQWETEVRAIPPMAYHLLRFLGDSKHFAIKHDDWEGWQIGRDGKLYAPGGRYSFEARELGAWWIRSQQLRTLEEDLAATRAALSDAEAENTKLRALFVGQGIVDEIASMQKRLGALWSRLNTAKVIPLPAKSAEPKKRAVPRAARGR